MAFVICHRYGDMESDPPLSCLGDLYAELETDDKEHPEVSVKHESEWTLSAYPSGALLWENVEDGTQPRHMMRVPRQRVLELWQKLAKGDITAIDTEPWLEGYPR